MLRLVFAAMFFGKDVDFLHRQHTGKHKGFYLKENLSHNSFIEDLLCEPQNVPDVILFRLGKDHSMGSLRQKFCDQIMQQLCKFVATDRCMTLQYSLVGMDPTYLYRGRKELLRPDANEPAQYFNHSLLWTSMSPVKNPFLVCRVPVKIHMDKLFKLLDSLVQCSARADEFSRCYNLLQQIPRLATARSKPRAKRKLILESSCPGYLTGSQVDIHFNTSRLA